MKFKPLAILFSLILWSVLGYGKSLGNSENYDSIAKRISKIKTAIPIEYNQYVQGYINDFVRNDDNQTSVLLGKGQVMLPEIEKILKKHHLPIELKYLAVGLSNLNTRKVSDEGSSGIWQLKYYVAKTYGLKINSYIDERRDPLKSTEAAALYFEDLYKIYEDWTLTMAAFYSSALDINKGIRQSGGNLEYWKIHSYLPEDIQKVVPRFTASIYIFNHFRDHKLSLQPYKTVPTDTVGIKNWTSFQQINKVLSIDVEFLKEYNPIYKKSIIPFNQKKYYINIPEGMSKAFHLLEDSLYIFKDKEPGLVTIPDGKTKPTIVGDSSQIDDGTNQQTQANDSNATVEPVTPKPKPKPTTTTDNAKGEALLTYTVKKGDGLGKIADKYDCTITEIKKWNKLKSNTIRPGQKLKIYVPKSKLSKYKKIK